jgi:transposase
MTVSGKIMKQEKFNTTREDLRGFLAGLPCGTEVGMESLGFCWPWIDLIEELGYKPLLGDPIKLKHRAEDAKTDRIDSEFIAALLRIGWFPAVYIPDRELRWLRGLLRHRVFRRRISTALKNRTWSEFRKRDVELDVNLGTKRGRKIANSMGIYEVSQNLEILEVVEAQMKEVESKLMNRYAELKPIRLLQTIPGIGFIIALTLYAEICDIRRFSNPEKLAHYAGLVPRVRQSGGHTKYGRETTGNRWLKWVLTEAAWSHINWCPDGWLAKVFKAAYKRKRSKTKAIKIVARKLVNVVWAVWTYGKEYMIIPDKA